MVRALALYQCDLGFDFGTKRHMWLEFVVSSAPRGFSLGTPVFPFPQKPTLLNSNLIRNARTFDT